MAEGSFKSRDAHANLQITFMREIATGALAADIDIDESSGIEHGSKSFAMRFSASGQIRT